MNDALTGDARHPQPVPVDVNVNVNVTDVHGPFEPVSDATEQHR
ncbi:hypothetical protein [Herbiconiux sp.]|nr:hypothetical protein [Herbiconiux sp.]